MTKRGPETHEEVLGEFVIETHREAAKVLAGLLDDAAGKTKSDDPTIAKNAWDNIRLLSLISVAMEDKGGKGDKRVEELETRIASQATEIAQLQQDIAGLKRFNDDTLKALEAVRTDFATHAADTASALNEAAKKEKGAK